MFKRRFRSVSKQAVLGSEYAPDDAPVPEEERKLVTVRAIRILGLTAVIIYGGGVVYSHLIYSADDRAACYRVGGFAGRIWCPKSVDTAGFRVHFAKALGWPVDVFRAPATKAETIEKAASAIRDP